jgi:hypothetical protein
MTGKVAALKPFHPFMLTVLAPLALCACSENTADEAAQAEAVDGSSAAFDGSAPIGTGEANDEPLPDEAVFNESEETVFEGDPGTGGTEPMDSAEPMGGTEPMDEAFGSNEGASE